jgi:hypothetical protein
MQSKKEFDRKEISSLRDLVQSGASAIRASVALKRPLDVVKLKTRKSRAVPIRKGIRKDRSRISKSLA